MLQNNYRVVLKHTVVINVDEGSHSLPPDAGNFAEFQVADYTCPEEWSKDGVFVHAKEGDALWFDFRDYTHNTNWDCAVMPSMQKVNPLTGERVNVEAGLSKDPKQNYLRLPEQLWLDGYANDGKVYQFIFTKAGIKMGVNEFVLPEFEQDSHAIAFAFFAAKKPKDKPQPIGYRENFGHPVLDDCIYDQFKGIDLKQSFGAFAGACGASDNSNPMWFSPTHTPQNWQICNKNVTGSVGSVAGNVLRAQNLVASAPLCDNDSIAINNVAINYCCSVNDDIASVDPNTTIITHHHIDTSRELENALGVVEIDDVELGNLTKASMGAGGRITQEIKTDCNTVDYYEEKPAAILKVYLASTEQFDAIIKKGKKQDANKKDGYIHSGNICGIPVPLISK